MLLIGKVVRDILIINLLMVLNSVMVNYELYQRNYDFERFSLQYHWTAVAAAAATTAYCQRHASFMVRNHWDYLSCCGVVMIIVSAIILSLPWLLFELITLSISTYT